MNPLRCRIFRQASRIIIYIDDDGEYAGLAWNLLESRGVLYGYGIDDRIGHRCGSSFDKTLEGGELVEIWAGGEDG